MMPSSLGIYTEIEGCLCNRHVQGALQQTYAAKVLRMHMRVVLDLRMHSSEHMAQTSK